MPEVASIREPVAQVAGGATSVQLLVASPLNEIVVATCWQSISMVFVLISEVFLGFQLYCVSQGSAKCGISLCSCNFQYVGFCWFWFLIGVIEIHSKERLGCVPHSRGSQIARPRIVVILFVNIPELHKGPLFITVR